MIDALWMSNLLAWVAIVALMLVGFALARQVGVLSERLKPVGALVIDAGPAVGSVAPVFELFDLAQRAVRIGGIDRAGVGTLLFFVSPTCPICKTLLPLLPSVVANEPRAYRVVLASDGDVREHAAFHRNAVARAMGADTAYVLSQELGRTYQIGKLPYAVLLDEHGVVRAKGLVNTREHVESLFEAREAGIASIQAYAAGKRGAAEAA
ncbi:methylamine dehydrogenase accessory protein MauD,AhpC/TSA family [Burkholderia stabilis]|uniref:Methylamine utilization protein MauD n=2 Tax=Burkholderia stabilis TaxID=95485 RepID=A0AAJ5T8R2_9BURK|nr:methylamine dehydrogenase accessory protein MauD,AhpC/TSA family [Burkholderia stabilis]